MVSHDLEEILQTVGKPDYLNRWYGSDRQGLNLAPDLQTIARQLRGYININARREEASASADLADFCAGYLLSRREQVVLSNSPYRTIMLHKEPLGLVGLITPSNVPLAGLMWKMLPALACGNDVIIKPAPDELSTRIAEWVGQELLFGELSERVRVLRGENEAAIQLCHCPEVAAISFTGSHEAGKAVAAAAGTKKLSLEMGGHSVWIALPDVGLHNKSTVVASARSSAFSHGGTRCVSAKTFLVCEYQQANLVKYLREQLTHTAPVKIIDDEKELQVWMCKDPSPEEGVRVAAYTTLYELVEMANYSPYCLSAAVWTNDISKALWLTRQLKARTIHINGNTYGSEPQSPFGGEGWSGNGSREPGLEAFDFYSSTKQITMTERI